ncbi:MAG TPA: glycosyltransferase family 4 protein, partial [Planctomycetota bacterium]|nr:glycosyltransferase family 4 protein [Planctomycetota bacterium]
LRILYHHRIRADDGQAVHVREMIGALRALGHEVAECALVPKADPEPGAPGGAAPPRAAGFLRRLRVPRLLLEVLEVGYGRTATRRLVERGRALQPHFVYERHALHCRAGLRAARALGVPLLLEVNSPMCDEMAQLGLLRFPGAARKAEREVLGGAAVVLAVSEVLRARLIECGARPERTVVVRNGADPERFGDAARAAARRLRQARGLDERAFVVGFVGYARPWHRLDLVVRALADERLRDAHLWIAGDGPALPELRAAAAAAGLTGRVHCVGAVPPAELPAHVCAFDAAVIPAINAYASPLKLFDYLAAGVPAVVPDQPNLREVVTDGETALLCRPGDPEALVACVRRLAADRSFAAALGAAGRSALVERDWTWRGAARRVLAAYAEVAA